MAEQTHDHIGKPGPATRLLAAAALMLMIAVPTTAPAVDAGPDATAAETTAVPRGEPTYAVTAFGLEPEYPEGFDAWNYINVDAPRQGILRASAFGSFDTLNRFTLRGDDAQGLAAIDSALGVSSADETSVVYANIAESFEVAEDRTWLIINLRDDTYFHDGHPITAEDVLFTYETLINEAHPGYRLQLFAAVESYEALDDHTVRVTFNDTSDPSSIVNATAIPVLPAHYWQDRDFDTLTVEPPLGSGPYRIARLDPGRWIEYEYVPDWWGADLPRNRGVYNFERIRYDYYRDNTVRYEALRAGAFDYIGVTDPRQWALGFENAPAIENGTLVMNAIPYEGPESYGSITMNMRRAPFDDVRVRRAVSHLFDFEAANRTILFGLYNRNTSLFQNTEFAAEGRPGPDELALLEPLRDQLPEAVFGEAYLPPATDGTGRNRERLREIVEMLAEAGYRIVEGRMIHEQTGRPLSFQVMYADPTVERMLLHYQDSLRRVGIEMRPRLLQGGQWVNAYNDRDYDAIVGFLQGTGGYPPRRWVRDFFSSATAEIPGSQNASGIADPALDTLIDAVITSQTWDERVTAARAFDRYHRLLHLSVPLYYDPAMRIIHWDVFGIPETRPRFGFSISAMWWHDPSNPAALHQNR